MSAKKPVTKAEFKPVKVGDRIERDGFTVEVVQAADPDLKNHSQWYQTSVEPIVRSRGYSGLGGWGGYITSDEALGGREQHYSPPFVAKGQRRDPVKLTKDDWNFAKLLQQPREVKTVALFHELARESSRIREACRVATTMSEGLARQQAEEKAALKAWIAAREELRKCKDEVKRVCEERRRMKKEGKKAGKAWLKRSIGTLRELKNAKEAERNADSAHSACEVLSRFSQELHGIESAEKFLRRIEACFPFGAGAINRLLVAQDTPWNRLAQEQRASLVEAARLRYLNRPKALYGTAHKDLPPTNWMFWNKMWPPGSQPLQFKFGYDPSGYLANDSDTTRAYLKLCGNGTDAPQILTQAIECCVCFNFADDVIVECFRQWLADRRTFLAKQLPRFGESVGGVTMERTEEHRVNAALKQLSALRLRAHFPQAKTAAEAWRMLYPKKRGDHAKNEAKPEKQVREDAKAAIKLGADFFKWCRLDSDKPAPPLTHAWEHRCAMCDLLSDESPRTEPRRGAFREWRCRQCDHRESSKWDGIGWVEARC